MRSVSDNKGITLIALIVTIIVLLIIAGISISGGIQGIDNANDSRAMGDLEKVQHAISQRYTKYNLTKDKTLLVGTKLDTLPTLPTKEGETETKWKVFQVTSGETVSIHPERKYYRLSKADLNDLGLTGDFQGASYVVNYYSGEVYDENQQQTSKGDILYKTSIENEASELGDEVIQDDMLVWYDAINNTGSGHSNNTNVWKDLSGNGNDATLSGFNGTATSGWNSNYLAFDGQNDWGKTVKEVDYNNSKELTIEFTDVNGCLLQNSTVSLPFESSTNCNRNDMGFGVSISEWGEKKLCIFIHSNSSGFNAKVTPELNTIFNKCAIVFNTSESNKNFIKIYQNGEALILSNAYNNDISNTAFKNYVMFLASRNGQSLFTKMNLANFRIYNKVLSADEIKHNYILDKARYGIEE